MSAIRHKKINAPKLEALGFDKLRQACLAHAESALRAIENGDGAKFERSCNLLDQCARLGRKMKGKR